MVSNSSLYKVLIVGAGKMGAFFDSPQDDCVLTHAHAFSKNKNFCISGFIDIDISQATAAARRWGSVAFSDLDTAFKSIGTVDVVVVATPDSTHAAMVEEICRYSPKLIFLEKPIGKTINEIRQIREMCQNKEIDVLINYSRRFVKEFQVLRTRIKEGALGAYVTGTGYYGKGILHNGSHMTDLIGFLIGDIKSAQYLSSVEDFYQDDPSLSVRLILENGQDFVMQAMDARVATIFEADLFFEKARIKILDAGFQIEEFSIADDPIFTGYKVFKSSSIVKTSLDQALAGAVENIEGHLQGGQKLLCTIDDGYKAAATALNLIEQMADR